MDHAFYGHVVMLHFSDFFGFFGFFGCFFFWRSGNIASVIFDFWYCIWVYICSQEDHLLLTYVYLN